MRIQGCQKKGGFTLVEVILAIIIALGILVVLLHFYQQATNLRTQLIEETERISAARLILDRLTSELRATSATASASTAFVGESNSIQFVRADVPALASWSGAALGRSTFPVTDLKRIKYQLQLEEGTNVSGLLRTEEPLVGQRSVAADEDDFEGADIGTSANRAPAITEIRFLQFRYWSGTNWLDSWSSPGIPIGVEVSLGAEPATNGLDLAEYPGEIFRRIVYLGSHGTTPPVAAASQPGPATTSTSEETP
jgi:type II secretory pathway pseudopilin PulG